MLIEGESLNWKYNPESLPAHRVGLSYSLRDVPVARQAANVERTQRTWPNWFSPDLIPEVSQVFDKKTATFYGYVDLTILLGNPVYP